MGLGRPVAAADSRGVGSWRSWTEAWKASGRRSGPPTWDPWAGASLGFAEELDRPRCAAATAPCRGAPTVRACSRRCATQGVVVSPLQKGAEQALERAHRWCRRWGGAAL